MSVPEMVIKRRDENILRAIERTISVYYLAWEIKRDIKEVHGTLGFDWIKKKNWSRTERSYALFKLHQFLLSTYITGHFVIWFYLGDFMKFVTQR